MRTFEFVQLEIRDSIATLSFNRPPVNALTVPMFKDITAAIGEINDRSNGVNVGIVTGIGKHFCAGRDLKVAEVEDPDVRMKYAMEAFGAVYHCEVPLIAAVNGAAVGAGLAFAANCDIVIASERAFFAMGEIDAGVNPSVATLLRGFNQYQARAMAFTGERYTAEDLHRMGMVRKVVPHEELIPEAMMLAQVLAAKSSMALRSAKWSANEVEALLANFEQAYHAIEIRVSRSNMDSADRKEAGKAFAEKRAPVFTKS